MQPWLRLKAARGAANEGDAEPAVISGSCKTQKALCLGGTPGYLWEGMFVRLFVVDRRMDAQASSTHPVRRFSEVS